ncbi:MAG: HIT family protein [Acidobacteriota bacterium]|nr:HIT family protein [Acidobacteriota bacterium]MDE3043406.1 HIT family protein [Acidobacteriota bacterium]MDE3221980.1 HIT family protein [Acidobacteriota bacterium]
MTSCVVCDEVSGVVAVPGGYVSSGTFSVAFHVPSLDGSDVYSGHILVVPKRHVADFAALTQEEASEIGVAIATCSNALKGIGAERVYVATVGHSIDHLHVHLLPRWPGTPREVPWHAVDDWVGARRVNTSQASDVVVRLRTKVVKGPDQV